MYNRCNCLLCRYPSLSAMMMQTWCTNWWTYRVWRCTATPMSPCWQIFLCRHWLWGLVFLCHHYNGHCLCCTVCLSASCFCPFSLSVSVCLSVSLSVSVCLSFSVSVCLLLLCICFYLIVRMFCVTHLFRALFLSSLSVFFFFLSFC